MASVTLDNVHMHPVDDPDSQITAVLTSERESSNRAGTTRMYAGGRRRSVTRPGLTVDLDIGLQFLARATVNTLRDWVENEQLLVLREPRGRVLFGNVFGLQITEIAGTDEGFADVTFTFSKVTYDESV